MEFSLVLSVFELFFVKKRHLIAKFFDVSEVLDRSICLICRRLLNVLFERLESKPN